MSSEFMTAANCERFLKYLSISSDDDCWEWIGARTNAGYGEFHLNRCTVYSHRVAWQWENGAIPDNKFICHHCDTPSCCNPAHLFFGTHDDNMADAAQKGRMQRPERRGTLHKDAKLNEGSVQEIRRLAHQGEGTQSLGRRFGVSHKSVEKILKGRSWAWLPEEPD